MSATVSILPNDDRTNGWSQLLPRRSARPALHGAKTFDWVVVGAGFTGLAAARRLAENRPADSIALIDAGEVAENASGRNSGFATELPHGDGLSAEAVGRAKRSIRVGRYAMSSLEALVAEHRIDCNWRRAGKYRAAVTEIVSRNVLDANARALEAWGEPFERVNRTQLSTRLGTTHYCSAVYTPGACLMNPAALCRGLVDSLPGNVTVFENSAVTAFSFDGARQFVETSQGSIEFGRLILGVNAFAGQFNVFRDRMIPIVLFASLTPPLSNAEVEGLGTERQWGVTPAHAVAGSTLRLTSDRRLLIRQGFEYSPGFRCSDARRDAARQEHMLLLKKRFPDLAALSIDHFWMGWLAVSRNQAPAFGQISRNVFAASCCNGVGIVRNSAAGMLIADLACGVENDLIDDFKANGTADVLPPRPILDIGVRSKLLWETIRGRREA